MPDRFRAFLRATRAHDNPDGDFVRDARTDRGLPAVTSLRELEGYLRYGIGVGQACPEAYRAARRVWHRFERWTRRRHE